MWQHAFKGVLNSRVIDGLTSQGFFTQAFINQMMNGVDYY